MKAHSRFVPRQIFKLGPIRIHRTDYLKSPVFELMAGFLYVSVGKRHFSFSVRF